MSRLLFACAVLSAFACAARSAEATRPRIPAYERFYHQDAQTDATQAGRLLLGELQCLACHSAAKKNTADRITPKAAPVLDRAATRIQPDYLRKYLADPASVRPGATMPNVLGSVPADQRPAAVEALVQYLASVARQPAAITYPRVGDGKAGETLFHRVGCAACHGSQRPGAKPLTGGKPLGDLSRKYTLDGLARFLRDPHAVRPGGRMPSLNLSGEEAQRIAAYLLKLPEFATVKYSYYEGEWDRLPDFSKLKPVDFGGAEDIDVRVAKRRDSFGLRFEASLRIDTAGEYTFHLRSDDGSRLLIDGKVVVDNDGIHAERSASGKARLTAGTHAVVVDFFERGGGERVLAEYEGPGVKRGLLRRALSAGSGGAQEKPPSLVVKLDKEKVEQGRRWFASLGCAACHTLREAGRPVASRLEAKPLAELAPQNPGCLSDAPPATVARYGLDATQRAHLAAAIQAEQQALVPPTTAKQQIVHTLATFNCYACHERDKQGGVPLEINAVFETTTKEMGDEGRIPPTLTGVGAKLTDKWMQRILEEGAKDRPYMLTRMPRFGSGPLGSLGARLAKVDIRAEDQLPPAKFQQPLKEVKAIGRRLVGDKGFSCIKCHGFGQFEATGIQSINLRIMTARLRESWFRRYLRNPQAFRPRTRMPSAWPLTGPSLFEEYFGGNSDQQIGAVWTYLADGTRAKIPSGIQIKTLELIPIDEAIIYRNFIQGAGPRAIAVGYPEGVHLAFDANDLRLALLWQGRFIDASRHWSGRGQGFQPPAGDKRISLPPGVPIARLATPETVWPSANGRSAGYRFRGYRLTDDQRPTFLYEAAGVRVEDHFDTTIEEAGVTLRRRMKMQTLSAADPAYLRLASAAEIRKDSGGWYVVGSNYRTRLGGDGKRLTPLLRKSKGRMELLLPLPAKGQSIEFHQDYKW